MDQNNYIAQVLLQNDIYHFDHKHSPRLTNSGLTTRPLQSIP